MDRDAALRVGDEHDESDHQQEEDQDDRYQDDILHPAGTDVLDARLVEILPQHRGAVGDAGDNAREQQDRNPVADALFVDLLAQPHHQRRAGSKAQDDDNRAEPEAKAAFRFADQCAVRILYHEVVRNAEQQAKADGGVTGDLPQLFAAGFTVLGHPLQRGDGDRQQLDDDAGVDVRRDRQRENTRVGKAAAGQQGEIIHHRAG